MHVGRLLCDFIIIQSNASYLCVFYSSLLLVLLSLFIWLQRASAAAAHRQPKAALPYQQVAHTYSDSTAYT
jgi:hypothetical protein